VNAKLPPRDLPDGLKEIYSEGIRSKADIIAYVGVGAYAFAVKMRLVSDLPAIGTTDFDFIDGPYAGPRGRAIFYPAVFVMSFISFMSLMSFTERSASHS
jgi:hypothetical protein